MKRIERLVVTGYLQHKRLPAWRSIYHLTHRALVSFPSVLARGTAAMRKAQSTSQAHYFWLRAALCAELVGDGYTVGRGPRELAALRRFYVDGQRRTIARLNGAGDAGAGDADARAAAERVLLALRQEHALKPPFRARCSRCGFGEPLNVAMERCKKCDAPAKNSVPQRLYRCRACGALTDELCAEHPRSGHLVEGCRGALREIDVLSIDIAWRCVRESYEVIGLFIDDPRRALPAQLDEIPAQLVGLPLLPLIVRSTDARSRFDGRTRTWRAQGPRHKALLRAFSPESNEALFPFSLTTKVIDYRPELQLWAIYPGAKS